MAVKSPARQQNAILSVYDKAGLEDFAAGLVSLNWTLYASTGTFKYLNAAGIPVKDVADLTGWGQMLDHRVVTLHPKVHGGILADTGKPDHLATLSEKDIPLIGLVDVSLYPLEEEIADTNATKQSIIEKIDIGGPTLLNGAAKSRRIVISTAEQRQQVLEWLKAGKPEEEEFLDKLAFRAFYETSRYYQIIAKHLGGRQISGHMGLLVAPTRYGENPWQKEAGLYVDNRIDIDPLGVDQFQHVKGWDKSFINETDIGRLVQTATHIAAGYSKNFGNVPPIAIGIKHGNACGAAVAETHAEAAKKALEGDTRAIFGGVIMINGKIDAEVANILMTHAMEAGKKRMLDAVIGASVTDEAKEILNRAKLRIIVNPALANLSEASLDTKRRISYVRAGVLEQDNYTYILDLNADYIDRYGEFSHQQKQDLVLAWAVGCTSNSNTITLVKNGKLIGNGVGQQDRIGAAQLALIRTTTELPQFEKSNEGLYLKVLLNEQKLEGAVAYSDSFYPFTDGPLVLVKAGIRTILSTSGSIMDEVVIKELTDAGVNLMMMPDKIGRGFFGH